MMNVMNQLMKGERGKMTSQVVTTNRCGYKGIMYKLIDVQIQIKEV